MCSVHSGDGDAEPRGCDCCGWCDDSWSGNFGDNSCCGEVTASVGLVFRVALVCCGGSAPPVPLQCTPICMGGIGIGGGGCGGMAADLT
jgi:hypothetical protein